MLRLPPFGSKLYMGGCQNYGPFLGSYYNTPPTQRLHVVIWYILGPYSSHMGTSLGPKYVPYSYMEPLG